MVASGTDNAGIWPVADGAVALYRLSRGDQTSKQETKQSQQETKYSQHSFNLWSRTRHNTAPLNIMNGNCHKTFCVTVS